MPLSSPITSCVVPFHSQLPVDGVFRSSPFSFGGFEIFNTFSSSQGLIEEDFIQIIPSFATKNITLSGVALGVSSSFSALLESDGVEKVGCSAGLVEIIKVHCGGSKNGGISISRGGKVEDSKIKKRKCLRLQSERPKMNLGEDIMMEQVLELVEKLAVGRVRGRKFNFKMLLVMVGGMYPKPTYSRNPWGMFASKRMVPTKVRTFRGI